MLIIKRNQILIVTLVIMIAIAGYLNYSDKREDEELLLSDELNIDLVPGAILKNVDEEIDFEEDDENLGVATLLEDDYDDGMQEEFDDFFLEAKLNRDEVREERKEWLMELINTVAVSDQAKEDAYSEILAIQNVLERENQIESLIESKGFGKTYVRIDDDGMIDIIVKKQNLSQNEIAQISDIVRRVANVEISNLKISSYKERID